MKPSNSNNLEKKSGKKANNKGDIAKRWCISQKPSRNMSCRESIKSCRYLKMTVNFLVQCVRGNPSAFWTFSFAAFACDFKLQDAQHTGSLANVVKKQANAGRMCQMWTSRMCIAPAKRALSVGQLYLSLYLLTNNQEFQHSDRYRWRPPHCSKVVNQHKTGWWIVQENKNLSESTPRFRKLGKTKTNAQKHQEDFLCPSEIPGSCTETQNSAATAFTMHHAWSVWDRFSKLVATHVPFKCRWKHFEVPCLMCSLFVVPLFSVSAENGT